MDPCRASISIYLKPVGAFERETSLLVRNKRILAVAHRQGTDLSVVLGSRGKWDKARD